jgi:hypothetical protein
LKEETVQNVVEMLSLLRHILPSGDWVYDLSKGTVAVWTEGGRNRLCLLLSFICFTDRRKQMIHSALG